MKNTELCYTANVSVLDIALLTHYEISAEFTLTVFSNICEKINNLLVHEYPSM